MDGNISGTIGLAVAYLILFSSAELMHHKLKFKAEVTRKYVHVVTGIFALSFPFLVANQWLVLLLCGSFFIILSLTIKSSWLRSIHGVARKTSGSLLYPIIVYSCYLAYEYFDSLVFYYTPILILALSDPIAALVGKTWPRGKFLSFGQQKTLSGSAGFFLSSLIICFALFFGFESMPLFSTILLAFALSLCCSLAEAISHNGYDNISIPYTALLVLGISSHYFQLF